MLKSIFISKHTGEVKELQQYANANTIELVAHSFLRFEQLDFVLPDLFDVLFFGSPRAVMYFQARHSIPKNKQIACVGGKTAALLESMGHTLAFNGAEKGSISAVASAFQEWLGDRKALFPVSTRSLGTISKGLPSKQVAHVECYDTVIQSRLLESDFDVYVFTSPSNVEGFIQENTLPKGAKIIAWGESTAKALSSNNIAPFSILEKPSQEALVAVLSEI